MTQTGIISAWRAKTGSSFSWLARRIGKSYDTVLRWDNGKAHPELGDALAIARETFEEIPITVWGYK